MEEGLVLNVRESRVMQVVAKHKRAWLEHYVLLVLTLIVLAILYDLILFFGDPRNSVLAGLLVQLALH